MEWGEDMKQSLQNKILKHTPTSKRSPLDLYGVECGDGWYILLDRLMSKIQEVIKSDNLTDFGVATIKEKLGMLRVYVYNSNDEIDKLISDAERESGTICEQCGEPGHHIKIKRWFLTACPKHEEEYKRRFK